MGLKPRNFEKVSKKPSFYDVFVVIFEVFQSFLVLDPILAHQITKFEFSGYFCFSRHPWGLWGSQSSGVKPKSANPVTVRMALSGNYEIVTKTLFLMTLIIKLTLGNIFIKVKNPPGGATVTN